MENKSKSWQFAKRILVMYEDDIQDVMDKRLTEHELEIHEPELLDYVVDDDLRPIAKTFLKIEKLWATDNVANYIANVVIKILPDYTLSVLINTILYSDKSFNEGVDQLAGCIRQAHMVKKLGNWYCARGAIPNPMTRVVYANNKIAPLALDPLVRELTRVFGKGSQVLLDVREFGNRVHLKFGESVARKGGPLGNAETLECLSGLNLEVKTRYDFNGGEYIANLITPVPFARLHNAYGHRKADMFILRSDIRKYMELLNRAPTYEDGLDWHVLELGNIVG